MREKWTFFAFPIAVLLYFVCGVFVVDDPASFIEHFAYSTLLGAMLGTGLLKLCLVDYKKWIFHTGMAGALGFHLSSLLFDPSIYWLYLIAFGIILCILGEIREWKVKYYDALSNRTEAGYPRTGTPPESSEDQNSVSQH